MSDSKDEMDVDSNFQNLKERFEEKMSRLLSTPLYQQVIPQTLQTEPIEEKLIAIVTGNELDRGGQGVIYEVKDNNNYLIKKSICPSPSFQENCERISNYTIYQTPNSTGKEVISFPDTISESVIGGILNNTSDSTFGFVKNCGITWGSTFSYSIVERVQTDLFSAKINNTDEFLVMFAQYLHTLAVSQQLYRFTHYDSHLGNILVKNKCIGWIKCI